MTKKTEKKKTAAKKEAPSKFETQANSLTLEQLKVMAFDLQVKAAQTQQQLQAVLVAINNAEGKTNVGTTQKKDKSS